jgi:hypothetical protein
VVPRLGRAIVAPRLRAANHVMFDDLARAAISQNAASSARNSMPRPLAASRPTSASGA